jgi:hypothetical protein
MEFRSVGIIRDVYTSDKGSVYFTLMENEGEVRFRAGTPEVAGVVVNAYQSLPPMSSVELTGVVRGRSFGGNTGLALLSATVKPIK